jgi:hypothetical protein
MLPIGRERRLRYVAVFFGQLTQQATQALLVVRHRYAHHIANAHLTVKDICDKIAAEGGDKQLLSKLIGLGQPKEIGPVTTSFLRSIMFYNVAWFLAAAVHLTKTPPVPPGGLFSLYFDKGGSWKR